MSIYTRKGDTGNTRLFSGEQVGKDDLRVQTYGTMDELQAQLGMVRALLRDPELACTVYGIQQEISAACAEVASNPETYARLKRRVGRADATKLEGRIDALVATYGLPNGFIIPGRSVESAAVHVSRTVCRRVERLLVLLNRELKVFDEMLVYYNRLSDYLFTLGWALEMRSIVEGAVTETLREGH